MTDGNLDNSSLESALEYRSGVVGLLQGYNTSHPGVLQDGQLTNFSLDIPGDLEEEEYVYDYNYTDTISIPLEELIPVTSVYVFTLVLGVVGNVLVIFSIARYRRMQTVTNIFLTSLASADLLLVLLCVPIKLAKWYTFSWEYGEVLCKTVHYMQNVSVICSVLTLTSMSIERYYAILHPMKAKFLCTVSRAKKVIILVWFLSFILASPIIVGQVLTEVGVRVTAYWCWKQWDHPVYSKLYEVGMLLLIFVFPLFIISFAYFNICLELWIMTSKRAIMRAGNESDTEMAYVNQDGRTDKGPIRLRRRRKPQSDDDKTRKQVIKMLVIVICLFAVCWGPGLIDNVLVVFGVLEKLNYGYLKHMRQAFAVMSYFNSCVNPIVYAFMSKNFRESFKYAICSCVRGKHGRGWTSHHKRQNPSDMRREAYGGACYANHHTSGQQECLLETSTVLPDVVINNTPLTVTAQETSL